MITNSRGTTSRATRAMAMGTGSPEERVDSEDESGAGKGLLRVLLQRHYLFGTGFSTHEARRRDVQVTSESVPDLLARGASVVVVDRDREVGVAAPVDHELIAAGARVDLL